MMKAASFAPLLEEEIPLNSSPSAVDNGDNTEQAGRTPHFKKLEVERNISLLKNSLQTSGMKINAALYDSPMSFVSTGSENMHPNMIKAQDSAKKGLSNPKALTKKALLNASQSSGSWMSTPSVLTSATPMPIISSAAGTPTVASIPPTPVVMATTKPTATVTFRDSVGGPLATELPASVSSTPSTFVASSVKLSPESIMSMHSAPAMPLVSPTLPSDKPQHTSPDRLWALLMGGSPSSDSINTTGDADQEQSLEERSIGMSQPSFGSPGNSSVLSALPAPPSSAARFSSAMGIDMFNSSPESVVISDMSQVTASPMALSTFAHGEPSPQLLEALQVAAPAPIQGAMQMQQAAAQNTPGTARASPAAASVASTAHSPASSVPMASPIAHFQYSQSPASAAKPQRAPSPAAAQVPVTLASPIAGPTASAKPSPASALPVMATLSASPVTVPALDRAVAASPVMSPAAPVDVSMGNDYSAMTNDDDEEEAVFSPQDWAPIDFSHTVPPIPSSPEMNDTLNTSVATISSCTGSVLLRRGGVAFGHGPRLHAASRSAYANPAPVGIAMMDNSFARSTISKASKTRSPVSKASEGQTVPSSAAKPAAPRQGAASKADRKRDHPSIPRPTKSSSAKASPKATSRMSSSGVSRSCKRTKGDTACDASTSVSFSTLNSSAVSAVAEDLTSVTATAVEVDASAEASVDASPLKCNVSIQCDSMMLAGSPAPVAVSVDLPETVSAQPSPLSGRSAYDCFEEGLDEAMSVNASHVQHSATLDYSLDTPEVVRRTPQDRHHSPIFMSYRKLHHDSDSEEDAMLQMGLDELLAGSPEQASPIAKRHSFEESSCMPLEPRRVEWEHSFTEPAAARATTPSSASSSRPPRSVTIRKTALGSAKRVSPHGKIESHVVYSAHEHEHLDESTHVSTQWNHSVDYSHNTSMVSALGESQYGVNATAMTDVAVVRGNLSATSAISEALDYSMSRSDASCAETTLTLDGRTPEEVAASPSARGPKLVVKSQKRDRSAAEDVKEIGFCTYPGETTTVELTIANQKDKTIKVHSHAVSLRFEEYVTAPSGQVYLRGPSDSGDDGFTVDSAAPPCSFEVSPAVMKIAPGGVSTLYVTFVPQRDIVGVYSGAVKVRQGSKHLQTFLLRGKAVLTAPSAHAAHADVPAPASVQNAGIAAVPSASSVVSAESSLMQRLQKLNKSPASAAPSKTASPSTASPAPASVVTAVSASPKQFSVLAIQSQSLLLQKSAHCQRYEAALTLELKNGEFSDLSLSTSAAFLKLSRSRVILSGGNQESVKILLDERSPELLQLCNTVLAQDPANCTTALAGFVTVKSATEGEYTVDVSLTRSACFLIRQQHQQHQQLLQQQRSAEKLSAAVAPVSQSKVRSASTPRALIAPQQASCSARRPPIPTPRSHVQPQQASTPKSARSVAKAMSPASSVGAPVHRETPKSAPAVQSNASFAHTVVSEYEQSMAATAASLLMLRHSVFDSPSVASRRKSPSSKRSQSAPRTSPRAAPKPLGATSDIRNFLRAKEDTDATPLPRPALTAQPSQGTYPTALVVSTTQQVSAPEAPLMEKKTGVYFRKDCINYGPVAIGSLTRANIELCNGTNSQVTVYLGDPSRSFVLLHSEVTLRPQSYCRVPVRFLPAEEGEYSDELIAQTADGAYHTKILLLGAAYA